MIMARAASTRIAALQEAWIEERLQNVKMARMEQCRRQRSFRDLEVWAQKDRKGKRAATLRFTLAKRNGLFAFRMALMISKAAGRY